MTVLLLRRITILALIALALVGVLISTSSAINKGLLSRELSSQTRQMVEPLQARLETRQRSREASLIALRARAWMARDEATARRALQQEIETAFQSGVMLNLSPRSSEGARIDFQFHWRGDEAALQHALLRLQLQVPNLVLDGVAMRVVLQDGRSLIEFEARASHDWMAQ